MAKSKKYEGSKADERMDKKQNFKEGSKKEKSADKKEAKKGKK